jgi:hypothetical protein
MIKVIDDFLTPSYFEELQNLILSWNFDWYCQPNLSPSRPGPARVNFSHNFYMEEVRSPHCPLILPFMYQVKDICGAKQLLRCRADLTMIHPDKIKHPPHVDFPEPHYSSVFYVNESDGETIMYNERWNGDYPDIDTLTVRQVIEPKPNRVIIFDGDIIHTGHSPAIHQTRVILNSNYV